ncbi:unnamed protein product [Paramecium sonneborni]|uniref:Uncharacterized protein n=1 Tax=Paramecium sonneborni TaxID=65129 RepID=A0A8S1RIX3_9CILI|nr:unnamed protein product [Paramecium sonneborni]
MKIKVVFENKIHKLPYSINNYKEIRETIQCLYPQNLGENFEIYTQVLPKQTPFRINDEEHFNYLKQCYGHLQLKFIIKNSKDKSYLKQDEIESLNQSILIQYNNQDNNDIIFNQQKQRYTNPQILDINSFETKQSTLECFIKELVDQRLEFHGLLQPKIQPVFKMNIEYCQSTQTVIPGKSFLWSVRLRNTSNIKWSKQEVYLMCIEGQFLEQKLFFNYDIPINEICTIGAKLIAPQYLSNSPQIFQLFHKEQSFGKQIIFTLKNKEKLEQRKQFLLKKLQKIIQRQQLQLKTEFFYILNQNKILNSKKQKKIVDLI